jgi:ubiquinone/menaquinone biosynthesis C-methylase UbiE
MTLQAKCPGENESVKEEFPADTQDNNDNGSCWGTRRWFESNFTDYDGSAASYYSHALNGYEKYRHTKNLEVFNKRLRPSQERMILDIGSALGDLTQKVSNVCPGSTVIGIDFVSAVVRQASLLHQKLAFAVAALPNLPFQADSFDLILASEVLYYLPSEERLYALATICRLLKPGGQMLFTSFLDDGTDYFSRSEAIDFIGSRLEIEHISFDYNRAHHQLSRQLGRVARLSDYFNDKQRVNTEKYASMRAILSWISNSPVLRMVARLGLGIVRHIALFTLSLEWLPRIMSYASQKLLGDKAITNIAIVARKQVG